MPRRFAPALGRLVPAALVALAVAFPAAALAQEPVQPDLTQEERRVAFKQLHKFLLLQKSRVKLAQGREQAKLVERAARGDKSARKALAARRGTRVRRPLEGEAPLPAPDFATRSAAPAGAQATASIPVSVRANNPAGDGAGAGQAEQCIAALGDQVVVAWNDGQGFNTGGDTQGYGWSNDGGATFTDGGDVPHPPAFPQWAWTSDPVVVVNEKTGEFFYCGLANPTLTTNGIGIARGRFTGGVFAFDSVFVVRSVSNASFFLDKQWMAADSLTGNLYVTNTTFTASGDQIDFYRSTNGGRTWSSAQTLSSAFDEGLVQGSRPAVGPNGEVYVTWSAIGQLNDFDYMRFRRSLDGGVTFDPEVDACQFISNFGSGAPAFNRERGISFPSIAVDRTTGANRGRIYVAWNESWDWLNDGFPALPGVTRADSDPLNNNTTNNTTGTANPFTVGQVLRGTLQTTGGATDQDYFSVALAAGERIFVYADSFTSGRAFTLRLFAPSPDGAQRLTYAAKLDSTSTQNYAVWIFQAPAAGTYYLRIAGISRRTMNYRIRTTAGVKGAELGRDQRDALVSWSDDGSSWSTPVLMNDDAVGFDNWLPEVAVGGDGLPYGMWFDHRNDTYGSRAHIYLARSTNGGATWGANARASDVQSNFTTAASNIAPNQGDYNHITASATEILPAWSDGRVASPDVNVYVTGIATTSAIASCPNDTTVDADAVIVAGWNLENHNPLFAGVHGVTVTSERNWPVSGPATIGIPAEGAAFYTANVTIPDTAAAGVNTVCLTLTTPGGVVVGECCYAVTVNAGNLAVGDHLTGFALAPSWPNPAHGSARIAFSLPSPGRVKLSVYDLAGARVRTLVDGERASGAQSVVWDGRDSQGATVRAGAYFVRLDFGGRSLTRRMVMTQ